MVSVRIINVDYYMSPPIPELDNVYSSFRGTEIRTVPVIQLFGPSSTGEKTCLHVHGVYPYIYVPYDGQENFDQLSYKMAAELDKSLNISFGQASANTTHIHKISLVSGRPLYGYHDGEYMFCKIYFYSPIVIKRACALLENGSILGRCYQPHESHINYILQFMIDYNLHGMSFINLSRVKYRIDPENETLINDLSDDLILPNNIHRRSYSKIEIDALASDITNVQDVAINDKFANPGLALLWADEKQRRRNNDLDSQISFNASQERPNMKSTVSHQFFKNKFLEKLSIKSSNESVVSDLNKSVYPAETTGNADTLNESTSQNETLTDTTLNTSLNLDTTADILNESDHNLLHILYELKENVEIEEDSILSQQITEPDTELFSEEEEAHNLTTPLQENDIDDVFSGNSCFENSLRIPQLDGEYDLADREFVINSTNTKIAEIIENIYKSNMEFLQHINGKDMKQEPKTDLKLQEIKSSSREKNIKFFDQLITRNANEVYINWMSDFIPIQNRLLPGKNNIILKEPRPIQHNLKINIIGDEMVKCCEKEKITCFGINEKKLFVIEPVVESNANVSDISVQNLKDMPISDFLYSSGSLNVKLNDALIESPLLSSTAVDCDDAKESHFLNFTTGTDPSFDTFSLTDNDENMFFDDIAKYPSNLNDILATIDIAEYSKNYIHNCTPINLFDELSDIIEIDTTTSTPMSTTNNQSKSVAIRKTRQRKNNKDKENSFKYNLRSRKKIPAHKCSCCSDKACLRFKGTIRNIKSYQNNNYIKNNMSYYTSNNNLALQELSFTRKNNKNLQIKTSQINELINQVDEIKDLAIKNNTNDFISDRKNVSPKNGNISPGKKNLINGSSVKGNAKLHVKDDSKNIVLEQERSFLQNKEKLSDKIVPNANNKNLAVKTSQIEQIVNSNINETINGHIIDNQDDNNNTNSFISETKIISPHNNQISPTKKISITNVSVRNLDLIKENTKLHNNEKSPDKIKSNAKVSYSNLDELSHPLIDNKNEQNTKLLIKNDTKNLISDIKQNNEKTPNKKQQNNKKHSNVSYWNLDGQGDSQSSDYSEKGSPIKDKIKIKKFRHHKQVNESKCNEIVKYNTRSKHRGEHDSQSSNSSSYSGKASPGGTPIHSPTKGCNISLKPIEIIPSSDLTKSADIGTSEPAVVHSNESFDTDLKALSASDINKIVDTSNCDSDTKALLKSSNLSPKVLLLRTAKDSRENDSARNDDKIINTSYSCDNLIEPNAIINKRKFTKSPKKKLESKLHNRYSPFIAKKVQIKFKINGNSEEPLKKRLRNSTSPPGVKNMLPSPKRVKDNLFDDGDKEAPVKDVLINLQKIPNNCENILKKPQKHSPNKPNCDKSPTNAKKRLFANDEAERKSCNYKLSKLDDSHYLQSRHFNKEMINSWRLNEDHFINSIDNKYGKMQKYSKFSPIRNISIPTLTDVGNIKYKIASFKNDNSSVQIEVKIDAENSVNNSESSQDNIKMCVPSDTSPDSKKVEESFLTNGISWRNKPKLSNTRGKNSIKSNYNCSDSIKQKVQNINTSPNEYFTSSKQGIGNDIDWYPDDEDCNGKTKTLSQQYEIDLTNRNITNTKLSGITAAEIYDLERGFAPQHCTSKAIEIIENDIDSGYDFSSNSSLNDTICNDIVSQIVQSTPKSEYSLTTSTSRQNRTKSNERTDLLSDKSEENSDCLFPAQLSVPGDYIALSVSPEKIQTSLHRAALLSIPFENKINCIPVQNLQPSITDNLLNLVDFQRTKPCRATQNVTNDLTLTNETSLTDNLLHLRNKKPRRLTSSETYILMPTGSPPTAAHVNATLSYYKLPENRFQQPFYSDYKDVTGKVDVGDNVLKIPSKSYVDYEEFNSAIIDLGLEAIRKERFQQLYPSQDMSNTNLRNILAGHSKLIITPAMLPPTKNEIISWLKRKVVKSDENQRTNKVVKSRIVIPSSPENGNESCNESITLSPCSPVTPKENDRVSPTPSDTSDIIYSTPTPKKPPPTFQRTRSRRRGNLQRKVLFSQTMKSSQGSHNSNESELDLNGVNLDSTKPRSNDSCQITGVTLDNTHGFEMSLVNLQNAKALSEYQYITLLVIELHIQTRVDLHPDPQYDPIRAIFYSIFNDVPDDSPTPREETGVFVVDTLFGTPPKFKRPPLLDGSGLNCNITYVKSERELIDIFVKFIRKTDPDIFAGYEIEMLSWGYLIERCSIIEINLSSMISRVNMTRTKPKQAESADSQHELKLPGRIILDIWRLLRHEIALQSYTFENLMYHVLHRRTPAHSFRDLTFWWEHKSNCYRHITASYYVERVTGVLKLLDQLDIIGRTSELARLFGIQFYEVLSRGSQFRVESLMLRLAKPLEYIPVSPSVQQRAKMKAPEWIPLIFEPKSRLYTDPIIVLDFQSLYPSIIIAYNYCFSTCIGRVDNIAPNEPYVFGATQLKIPRRTLEKIKQKLNFSPCGVGFVRPEVRQGVLPRMLQEILDTRLMVKRSMKENRDNKLLQRVLHNRQLGLKLIANVTYGYTAANFSGRMPCVEVADSVVSKGRETLERAIKLIDETKRWSAQVVYGDTDSVFVLVPGRSRQDAFKIGAEIAEAVTNDNPVPIKLKLEKVYQPCILQTKKRYVGYKYESPDQTEPDYCAKGIETVRRDGCPAVAKMLEKSLRLLFETQDVSIVKRYICRQFSKIQTGRVSIQDLTFAREFRGVSGYRPGACVPALELARKWATTDRRREPRRGQRVPYVVVNGPPGLPLIRLVRCPRELLADTSALRPNATYYITRVIIPALNRCFTLIGADINTWYNEMPRRQIQYLPSEVQNEKIKKSTISQYFATMSCAACGSQTQTGLCDSCRNSQQSTVIILQEKLNNWEQSQKEIAQICASCCGRTEYTICVSLDCPVLYRLSQNCRDVKQVPFVRNLLKTLLD